MNYYYRRYVAVLLTAFLLAAAAPFALAQETAKAKKVKKAEEQKTEVKKGSYATAQVLCSGLLSKSLLFSPKAAEFCAQHGVTAVSVFPNGSASSYYGGESSPEYEAYMAAKEYLDKCQQEEKAAEKKVDELRNKIKDLEDGPEKDKLKKELEKWEQYLKDIQKDIDYQAENVKKAQENLDALGKYTDEDWAKMAPELQKQFSENAAAAAAKASDAEGKYGPTYSLAMQAKDAADDYLDKYNAKMAEVEKYKKAGDDAAAQKAQAEADELYKNYEGAMGTYNNNSYWAEIYYNDMQTAQNEAAHWGELAEGMTGGTAAQEYVVGQAQEQLSNAQNNYQASVDKYNEQLPGLTAAQEAYNNYVSSYTPDEATQAEIDKLNESLKGAEDYLAYAHQQTQGAQDDFQAALDAYNQSQGVPSAAPATESGDQGGETPAVSCDDEVAACKAKCNKDDKDYKDCIKKCKALC